MGNFGVGWFEIENVAIDKALAHVTRNKIGFI